MKSWIYYCDICGDYIVIKVPDELSLFEAHQLKQEGKFKFYCDKHKNN